VSTEPGAIQLNGLDPYAYLRDVLERLPTQMTSDLSSLLPHCWGRAATTV